MTLIWGLVAATALLWPDRLSGPLDGVPLDRGAEAILIGVVLPALWLFHGRFLATRLARVTIVALVIWKIAAAFLFVQDGWCLRFEPSRPYVKDGTGAPHAWDLRADWRSPDPACSAIMTRSYGELHEFPAWFFNLPPPNESFPAPEDLPPEATTAMRVRGYVSTATPGSLDIDVGPGVKATVAVDGRTSELPAALTPGVHNIAIDGTLTGSRWWLKPRWNGADLWSTVTATVQRPSLASLRLRAVARWIPLALTTLLLGAWCTSAIARVRNVAVLAWAIGFSLVIGWLIVTDQVMTARWMMVALAAAIVVPVPPRLQNLRGAFLLVGVPWLTFVVVCAAPAIGRWVLYEFGNDYWLYQRWGYRIVIQGYWLEGGSPTFYFQPFYRWISGVLHAVFGDSSVGEWYWDGACLLAGSLLSFRLTRAYAGFRWGLVAAAAPLAVFELSSARDLIGRGLSEIASAGLLSMSAHCAIASRHRRYRFPGLAIAAGALATLAFYTRLNNLLMALGVAVFALSLKVPTRALIRPWSFAQLATTEDTGDTEVKGRSRRNLLLRILRVLRGGELWRSVAWRTAIAVPAVIGAGLLFFAWRTWHYTGVFSLFHGTQRYIVAIWQPNMPFRTSAYWAAYNVSQVLTVNDPPMFDIHAAPVIVGAIVAVLSLAGVPRLRNLPAAAVLFFFASIAGAFIARGWSYPGRFSVHIMPITCALAVCGVASLVRRPLTSGRSTLIRDQLAGGASRLAALLLP
jgi:hypothetical protein